MESVADNSSEHETSTVNKELEEPASKRKRNLWRKEYNWPRLKKDLERQSNPAVNEMCDAACLELRKDPVP